MVIRLRIEMYDSDCMPPKNGTCYPYTERRSCYIRNDNHFIASIQLRRVGIGCHAKLLQLWAGSEPFIVVIDSPYVVVTTPAIIATYRVIAFDEFKLQNKMTFPFFVVWYFFTCQNSHSKYFLALVQ